MAEFQSASAAIGLARDVVDLIQYLRKVKEAMGTVEDDIDGLINELESLDSLYSQLEQKYTCQPNEEILSAEQIELSTGLRETLNDGRNTFYKFDKTLKTVYGEDPKKQGWRDALMKQHRLRSNTPKLNALRTQIHTYNSVLQMWLIKISLANQ